MHPDASTVTPKRILRSLSMDPRPPRKRVVDLPASSPDYNREWWRKLRADPAKYEAYLQRQRKKDRARYERQKDARPPKQPRVVLKTGRSKFRSYLPKWRKWKAEQLERQRWKCAICRCDLRKVTFHVDHIVPRAAGGKAIETNLWILCRDCNMDKRDKRIFLL